MTFYSAAAALHVGVGAGALAAFWAATTARKGSPLHRRAGQAYLLLMVGIGLTSVPLLVSLFLQGRRAWVAFLTFIFLFVWTHCWMAWRAIRLRANWQRYASAAYRRVAWANLLAGMGILCLGLATGRVLLIAFSGAGIFAGCFNLRVAATPPVDTHWWLREHLRANLNNATATHISFFTIGLRTIVPALDRPLGMYVGWLGPLGVAILLRIYLEQRYHAKPTRRPHAA